MNRHPKSARVSGVLSLIVAACLVSACGDDTTPQGASIIGPGDQEWTYANMTSADVDATAAPLEFQVVDADGNPLPGVHIRFFAGGNVIMLMDRSGNPLTPADQWFFETTTNDQGVSPQDIYAAWAVAQCNATGDVELTGTVTATVGVTSTTWTLTAVSSTC